MLSTEFRLYLYLTCSLVIDNVTDNIVVLVLVVSLAVGYSYNHSIQSLIWLLRSKVWVASIVGVVNLIHWLLWSHQPCTEVQHSTVTGEYLILKYWYILRTEVWWLTRGEALSGFLPGPTAVQGVVLVVSTAWMGWSSQWPHSVWHQPSLQQHHNL